MKKIGVSLGTGIIKEPTPKFFNPYTESDMEKFYEIYARRLDASNLSIGSWKWWRIPDKQLDSDSFG